MQRGYLSNPKNIIFVLFFSGSVIEDTMKFAFLFFEFFIPYTVGFWIIFGGPENASKMIKHDWEEFNDLTFSVFMVRSFISKKQFFYIDESKNVTLKRVESIQIS